MTYTQLPIIEVALDNLLLDLSNYRIPTKRDDEAAALKYLFASEKVLEAARMILRDGYFDNEVPIVIPVAGSGPPKQYVVLEGNRRVSALKALQDPTLVPGHEADIRSLLKRFAVEAKSLPTRIRVIVAPDRATAAPHVARLHTGLSKKPWSLDQQATFYYSLLDATTTVDDVRAQYPSVSLARMVRMAVMRRFLTGAQFKDHSLREYAASDELRMSVFEYAYRVKDIAAAIGATFDKDGQLLPVSARPEKIASDLPDDKLSALEYLMGEFRADRLNTRSPEFKKGSIAQLALVARLNGTHAPAAGPTPAPAPESPTPPTGEDPPTEGPPTDDDPNAGPGGPGPGPNPDDPTSRRGPNHPDSKDTLDLAGMDYDKAPHNLKVRYFELRQISISKFPIAATILMRSVLESTIKVHYETSSPPASGELKEVFKRVVTDYGKDRSLLAAINNINSGNAQKVGSIQWFNFIAHGADATVTAQDVRNAWKLVNPILRRLLRSKQ